MPQGKSRKFKGDPSLTDEEIATISAWVDAGAARGELDDPPPPVSRPDAEAWEIGSPDLVLSLPSNYVVAAAGPDRSQDFILDTALTDDRYIQAVEIRPGVGARMVVHHVLAYVVDIDESGEERSELLNAYVMGRSAEVLPAVLPDMRVQPVNGVDRFNVGWQLAYNHADAAAPLLPVGTILHVIGWHDHSIANRANPDSRNWAGQGGRAIDEMSLGPLSRTRQGHLRAHERLGNKREGQHQGNVQRAPVRTSSVRTPMTRCSLPKWM